MLLETVVAALIPAAVESVKQLLTKYVGGVRPTTIDEQIKLEQQEILRLEAIAKLDTPGGTPSQWVIDLRASARYIAAGVVIIGGLSTLFVPLLPPIQQLGLEAANIAFGFLFGARLVTGFKK